MAELGLDSLPAKVIYDIVEMMGIDFRRSKDPNASRLLAAIVAKNGLENDLRWYAYVNFLDVLGIPIAKFPKLKNFCIGEDIDFDLIGRCMARGSNEASLLLFNDYKSKAKE